MQLTAYLSGVSLQKPPRARYNSPGKLVQLILKLKKNYNTLTQYIVQSSVNECEFGFPMWYTRGFFMEIRVTSN
jgi:hypothetical protein